MIFVELLEAGCCDKSAHDYRYAVRLQLLLDTILMILNAGIVLYEFDAARRQTLGLVANETLDSCQIALAKCALTGQTRQPRQPLFVFSQLKVL